MHKYSRKYIISLGLYDWLTHVMSSFPSVSTYISGRSGKQQWKLAAYPNFRLGEEKETFSLEPFNDRRPRLSTW